MKKRRGRVIAVAIGGLSLGTLAVAGVTFREPLVEAYGRWKSGYELGIRREGARVWIVLRNKTDRQMRIFEFWNSWGYWTLSFRVRDKANGKTGVLVRRRDVGFTRNFPAYFTIQAKGELEKEIDLNRTWILPDWLDLERGSYQFKAILTIEDSPEAREKGVFVGHLESGWEKN